MKPARLTTDFLISRHNHDIIPRKLQASCVIHIDGAGKSTQIFELDSWLTQCGLRTMLVTFWDDVVVMSRYRECMSRAVFRGDQGVGSPEKPLNRRDKNVSSWLMTAIRFCFYFADALNLRLSLRKLRKKETDVVIFDRFIYDELANLPLDGFVARAFAWIVLRLAPTRMWRTSSTRIRSRPKHASRSIRSNLCAATATRT